MEFIRLARVRFRSKKDYSRFQQFQANSVLNDLWRFFDLNQSYSVVDWGCGKNAGYSVVFSEHFEKVLGLDFSISYTSEKENLTLKEVDLLDYNTLEKHDFIFCSSVIEHVNNPQLLLKNISASLKVGGFLYLSFPPFYSLGGGHHAKPFHYLPEKWAIGIGKLLGRVGGKVTGYKNMFGTWGLYKRSIDSVWKMLESEGFRIIKCKPRYSKQNIKYQKFGSDFTTWHVEFYCEKRFYLK